MMIPKKLLLLSVLSGILLSIPWISGANSWTLFFAFVPLLMVENRIVDQKQSQGSIVLFLCAWVAFMVWNVLSTWWIAYVSLGGMILIALLNSFLMACVWWLMHGVRRKWTPQTGYFSLIVFWLTFEYLHFYWAIQWPWLTLGNGFSNSVKLIQWYEFTGVLGGSLWVLLVNILIFSVYKTVSQKAYRPSFQLSALILLLLILPVGGSLYRYLTYNENGKAVEVVLLQPNIDPYVEKFSGISQQEQTRRLIFLAQEMVNDSTSYVLAPETSLAPMWEDDSLKQNEALLAIDSFIGNYPSLRFVTGAITQRKLEADEPISHTSRQDVDGKYFDVFNSALFLDNSSEIQIGHKNILVSGVEKMPFQKYFSFLGKYVLSIGGISGSLTSGHEPSVFEAASGEKAGLTICFESAFGAYTGSMVRSGASVIFIITNDGWWKDSQGLTQHFAFSRLRAVETRRSIARSANTGISGFINQRGDVLKKTEVNTSTALSSPVHLNQALTFYVTHGDYLGRISSLLSGLILIYFLVGFLRSRG